MIRELGPLRLTGILATSLDEILELIVKDHPVETWAVSDLSLGAWRSHQVASELSLQLGLDPPVHDNTPAPERPPEADLISQWTDPDYRGPSDVSSGRSYADIIGEWIDNEGRGDGSAMSGLAHAQRIVGALRDQVPRLILVLAPRNGASIERENVQLVRFLAHGLRDTPHRLILVAGGAPHIWLPAGWEIAWLQASHVASAHRGDGGLHCLVPGIVEPAVENVLGTDGPLCRLPSGVSIVRPELRISRTRLDYDRLAAVTRSIGWLHAYALCHGNNYHVDSWRLCAEANKRLSEGGHGIALRLMERAITCARAPIQKAILQSMAQGWRIALQQYREVTSAPDPSPAIPALLRGVLLQTKGWGFVMTRQAESAEPYMRSALELLDPYFRNRREYLYLMNISALNRVNLGDLAGPLETEKEIERQAAGLPRRDYRLEYVNFINLARLYRRLGSFEDSREYYARAFSTTMGARSESDLIYTEVCLARLSTDEGHASDAFLGWLRAALYWLSSRAPEAIGWRTAAAIAGRAVPPETSVADEVTTALVKILAGAAKSAGVAAKHVADPPAFVNAEDLRAGTFDAAAGARGWGVLLSSTPGHSALAGAQIDELSALVYGLLASLSPALPEQVATVALDSRFGCGLPREPSDLIGSALTFGAPRVILEDRNVEIAEPARTALQMDLRLHLGPAVREVEPGGDGPAIVHFKRYREPRVLSAEELAIVDAASDGLALRDACDDGRGIDQAETTVRVARQLERDRVIGLEVSRASAVRLLGNIGDPGGGTKKR
ncbi:MAG: hypothetical protein HYX75_20725 [Acidobacteria bacterium]|nr:hypothetical protein [Acidobacteriota bacterium]